MVFFYFWQQARLFFFFITITSTLSLCGERCAATELLPAVMVYDSDASPDHAINWPLTTVLSGPAVQSASSQTVADVLRQVPGVEVIRQGGPGQATSIFLRGARSESTLVLVDGMEVNEVMANAGGFDFSLLSTTNVERIEVYHGPQSVRFGAGALGGVINIVTKGGEIKPRHDVLVEVGSFWSARTSMATSGKSGKLFYRLGGNYYSSQGFSATEEKQQNHRGEDDGVTVATTAVKLSRPLANGINIDTSARFMQGKVAIDSPGAVGVDDPNNHNFFQQWMAGIEASGISIFSAAASSSFGVFYAGDRRSHRNLPDDNNPTDSRDLFVSARQKIQWATLWPIGKFHTLHLQLGHRRESGNASSHFNQWQTQISPPSQSITGASFTYAWESPSWFLDLGLRADSSGSYGPIGSYRASLGKFFPRLHSKFSLSWGTGYKLPSLYQLYSVYGDENLRPETSSAMELAVERQITHHWGCAVTFFENKFREMIDFNLATDRFFNQARSRSQGIELQSSWEIFPFWKLSGFFTYLKAEDQNTHLSLLRRPQLVWKMALTFNNQLLEFEGQYSYRGTRDDIDADNFQRIKMLPYSLATLGAKYHFSPWARGYLRWENVLDEKYQEVAGFATARRSFYLGFSGDFD